MTELGSSDFWDLSAVRQIVATSFGYSGMPIAVVHANGEVIAHAGGKGQRRSTLASADRATRTVDCGGGRWQIEIPIWAATSFVGTLVLGPFGLGPRALDDRGAWFDQPSVDRLVAREQAVAQLLGQLASGTIHARATEQALQQCEGRYHSMVEQASDALVVADIASGRILDVSTRMCSMLGYDRADALCIHVLELKADRDADDLLLTNPERGAQTFETQAKHRSGARFWVDMSVDRDRADPSRILITMRDIAERKRTERMLELMKFVIDHTSDHAFWMGEDGRFVYVNQAACNALGYGQEQLLSRSVFDIDPAMTQDRWKQRWQDLRKHRVLVIETSHVDRGGRTFPVEVRSNYVEFEGHAYNCAFARDLTDRNRAGQQTSRLEQQLRHAQKMESVGLLAGGVAHDFNNLLTPIVGYADVLLHGMAAGDSRRDHVMQIKLAADRSKELVRQLLAFSRRQILELAVVDLGATIGHFERILRRTIRESIRIQVQVAEGLAPVRADIGQIEQVVLNLAINAQDAMPNGGVLTLELRNVEVDAAFSQEHPGVSPGPWVALLVTDSGIGMSQEVMDHLFEPFFTTKEPGRGTGLGLSTVYGIVQQHGGSIFVQSEVGKGSRFEILLPRESPQPAQVEDRVPDSGPIHGDETVLVVEDDEMVRVIARRMLETLGYRVLCAEGPSEAIHLANATPTKIDLLLADVVMPLMNGRALYETLKETRSDLVVLYMSGYTNDVVLHHGVADAGVHFIHKPFTIQALSERIRQVLDEDRDA